MKYIKPFIIEIFTTLLLQDKPIEVEKDYWWDEGDNIDENKEERRPEPQIFLPYFQKYLEEENLQNIIIIFDKKDKSIITLENTNEAKNKLKNYLHAYIKKYRKGVLEPDEFVNYFPYLKNLDYMREVLYKLSDGFKQTKIVLYSYRLLKEDKCRKDSDLLADERIRLSEFLLDLSFHPKHKKLIKINSCKMKRGDIRALGSIVLTANITLLEHPDVIYNILSKQLVFEQSISPIKAIERLRLEFPPVRERDKLSQNFYILLSKKRIELTKGQYDLIFGIVLENKKFGVKKKTMVSNINKKVRKEWLKDKNFKFLISNKSVHGTYYSLNKEKAFY